MNWPHSDFKLRVMRGALSVVARFPLGVLYAFSSCLAVLVHYVVRYRLRLVKRNLRDSFPERSESERQQYVRLFYRNFTDYIFETIKLLHISDDEIRRRITFSGMEHVDNPMRQGRSVVAYFSHCGNWEWVPSITLWSHMPHDGVESEFCQVYRPLRSHTMDELMLGLRSRFGSVSLKKQMAFLDLMRYKRKGVATVTGFMSDQKLSHGDPGHNVNFLHHPDTPFITGTEVLARRLDAAVVYFDISKLSRGFYHVKIRQITLEPNKLPAGALTDRYVSLLSETIRRNPPIWLWSHNRWRIPKSKL